MKLFELTTGKTGFSYERAYAWSEDEIQARQMFKAKFGIEPDETKFLLDSRTLAFITELSGEGWYRPTSEFYSKTNRERNQ